MYMTKLNKRHSNDLEVEYSDLTAIVQRKRKKILFIIVPKNYEEFLKMVGEGNEVNLI